MFFFQQTVDTHDGVGGGIAGDYREMPIDVPGQDPNAVFGYNASSNSPSHSSPHAVLPNALLTTSNHQQNRSVAFLGIFFCEI